MSKFIDVSTLSDFDPVQYLDCEEAMAAYLTYVLESNDSGLFAAALGDVSRARGMAGIAGAAGITREAQYKALRPGSALRFDTVSRVCTAFGFRLVVQPVGGEFKTIMEMTDCTPTLKEMLALFDKSKHGDEVMAFPALGKEVL